ncbi:hypothetical protein SAMN04244573_04706 [Azotobacter beijerinckii]|uniref:Uncharacterized protein n=1 Tax=Azotobacter beijerinckii TaxID=170623 RepID=A0A1H9TR78_9GAMM|nr:hypothetical protein SAMN04244573_04706 [Azotobacter beijerinckii]
MRSTEPNCCLARMPHSAIALAHREGAGSLGIHDHRCVAMALVQGELVHHPATHVAGIGGADRDLQAALVQRLEGVPVQPGEPADVADRQQLQQALDPGAQAWGRGQPGNVLGDAAAGEAIDTANGQAELHAPTKQVPVTDETDTPVMQQRAGLAATATARRLGDLGLEGEREGVLRGMAAGHDVVAGPESGNEPPPLRQESVGADEGRAYIVRSLASRSCWTRSAS